MEVSLSYKNGRYGKERWTKGRKGGGESAIPPVVVLATKLEVAEHDGDLRAGDDQDDEHQAQEAEQVVELVKPHGGQDEEELNEDCSKRQDASYEDAEHRVHVPARGQGSAKCCR